MCDNNNEKQPIMVKIENYTGSEPIQIIYREDEPINRLETIQAKMPEAFYINGIITAPADWLEKRTDHFDHNNARVEVVREDGTIKLIINERNCHGTISEHLDCSDGLSHEYDSAIGSDIMERSSVTGKIQMTGIFNKLHINDDGFWWDPIKLSAFFRLNRSYFADQTENMLLVAKLKNIKAKMSSEYEKAKDTFTGSRTEHYQLTVEHDLPKSFDMVIPIFKGSNPEKYNIEFDVDIVDGKLLLQLKSPAINDEVETARDTIIDAELKRIREIAPDLVIIEM